MIWLVALGVLGYVLFKDKAWPAGQGPFDEKPDGLEALPSESNVVFAASGNKYRVTSFKRGAAQTYHVAVRVDASHDWISFLVDQKTGQRAPFGANAATPAGLDTLRKDFAL
jgi:hypothetical protein